MVVTRSGVSGFSRPITPEPPGPTVTNLHNFPHIYSHLRTLLDLSSDFHNRLYAQPCDHVPKGRSLFVTKFSPIFYSHARYLSFSQATITYYSHIFFCSSSTTEEVQPSVLLFLTVLCKHKDEPTSTSAIRLS